MKTIAVIGWKNSGKTTLVSRLVAHLRKKKFKVGVVKHAHHSFDIDHPNTDSYKIREAGSYKTTIVSEKRLAHIEEKISPEIDIEELIKLNEEKYKSMFTIVLNEKQIGQTASIDKAYDMIKDECDYIFHCENDWLFYKRGFIEDSIKVLESQPKVLQAWIRPKNDGILNKIEDKVFMLPGGVAVRRVLPVNYSTGQINEDGTPRIIYNYMGFSFNPGLKRVSDYKLIGNYKSKNEEHLVDAFYRDNGYMVVSLSTNDQEGYVRHNGWDNRTENYEV